MEYQSKAYIYFSISGKGLNVESFSDLTGLIPTESGEDRFKEKFWEYRIDSSDANEDLENTIEKLMQLLALNSKKIQKYASEKSLYTKIFVIIHAKNKENNGFFLNQKAIKFLNDINAELEIDVYNE